MSRVVYGMYFSGTGTTKKMVTHIAKNIAVDMNILYEELDFTTPSSRIETKVFTKNDIVIFGVPVIAGRVPNLILNYINSVKGSGALGVPVVMFGNRSFDDALIELCNIMEAHGFQIIAGGAFVGEHSFSTILGKGRPDNSDMEEGKDFARAIVHKINVNTKEYKHINIPGENPLRPYYKPRDRKGNYIDILKVKPKTNSKCNNCGLCAKLCPLGSIDSEDFSKINGICMKCCACIKKCPQNAKYFDHEGYLYHKKELEEEYGKRRGENQWFI